MASLKTFASRLLSRWRWIVIFALAGAVIFVAGQRAIGSMIRTRVATALRANGIEFEADSAWYIPPWGVSLHGVRLRQIRPDGNLAQVFSASRVEVKLAHYPKTGQPIIVERLVIDSPEVIIPASPASESQAESAKPAQAPAQPAPARPALDKLEIHHLKITDGSISWPARNSEPLVLHHVNLSLEPSAGSNRIYRFSVVTDEADPNQVRGSGSINVDDMVLGISEITLHAEVGAIFSRVPIPEPMRRNLSGCAVGGKIDVRGNASVPFNDVDHPAFQFDVQLQAGKFLMPSGHVHVDRAEADIHFQGSSGAAGMQVTLRRFQATQGATALSVDGAQFRTTADGKNWCASEISGRLDIHGGVPVLDWSKVQGAVVFTGTASGPMEFSPDASALTAIQHEFLIYPRELSTQPWGFPIAVDHIEGGPISFRGDVVRFQNLRANYGGDLALLNDAHITLDDPRQNARLEDLRKQVRIEGIAGTLICHQPGPRYPMGMTETMEQLHPTGTFCTGAGSWFAVNKPAPGDVQKPKPDFFFRIASDKGAFALTNHKVPLTSISGEATVSPMLVNIIKIRGDCLGGTLIGSGKIVPELPVRYQGVATFYNADLGIAHGLLHAPQIKPLAGKAYLKTQFSGSGKGDRVSPLASFAADGEFEVIDGNFGDITTIRAAAEKVTKPDQSLDGMAAGIFSIEKETVTLQSCAVGNPLFGLQGTGTIGFDKTLDLHIAAAPLGDWHEALKQTQIPVVSDVGSGIAFGIQQMFNGAQRVLLWDVHVCGTTVTPKIEVVPAPIITAPVAALFAQLLQDGKDPDQHLVEKVRGATQPASAGAGR